ncbi:MAG: T9SS type A sorting domain-containing protein [Ignavibacteriota bacterium]
MKYFVSILLLCCFGGRSFSQIKFTESDILPLVGIEFTQTSFSDTNDDASITSLIAKSGQGQTWDLSSLQNYYPASTSSYIVQAGTAGIPDGGEPAFKSATHVIKVLYVTGLNGAAYSFITLSPSSYQNIGTYTDAGANSAALTFNPPKTEYPFPTEFGTKWGTTTVESVSGQSLNQIFTEEVDGEGTLLVPGGKSAPVLRLKETTITSISGFNDTSTTYRFLDKSNTINGTLTAPITKAFGPFTQVIKGNASFSARSQNNNGSVRSHGVQDISSLQNNPNPFSGKTTIHFKIGSSGSVRILIHDVLGRELQREDLGILAAGEYDHVISGSEFSEGSYYYTIEAGSERITKQMVVIR